MKKADIVWLWVAVALIVGFVAGTRSDQIEALIAPLFGYKVSADKIDTMHLQDVYQILKANYDGTVDDAKLIDGMSRGMVDAVGDSHTVYMSKAETDAFGKTLHGEVTGIGAQIGVRKGQPTVIAVLTHSPAEAAGVMKNDVITAVNDESTNGWTSAAAASKIIGDEGTTVKVRVLRGTEPKEFTIVRKKLDNPSVTSKIENNVGIMTITRFDDSTGTQARQAAESFVAAKVKSVVLDLRDNPGGEVDAAVAVVSLWVKDNLVLVQKSATGNSRDYRSTGSAILAGYKTIILVNGSSASASEITAGALQEYKLATLVGEKTYGKGSMQQMIDTGNGTMLKVTIAKWYTPGGRNIDKNGFVPDTVVTLTAADIDAGNDPQMAKALELAR